MRRAALILSPLVLAVPAAGLAQGGSTLEARVFADFNYFDTERPQAPRGFASGQTAGHLVARLSERFVFFGEVSATPVEQRFNVEVERAIIRFEHADWLRLSAGRYHTPVSYWNTSFHHGQWLQTTVGRPQMIRFGGTFLPVHFVGVTAEGRVPAGGTTLGYSLGVGNGRHGNPARAGDAGDVNASRAVSAATTLSVPGRTGLHLGVSYYRDRVTPGEGPLAGVDADERVWSAHMARERDNPEVFAEYARVAHTARTDGAEAVHSHAYYGQLAYRLPGAAHLLKPYVRAERVRPGAGDPLYAPLRLGYEGVIGGIRYDVGPATALKVEYRSEQFEGEGWSRTLAAQLSFTFAVRQGGEEGVPLPPPPPAEGPHGGH